MKRMQRLNKSLFMIALVVIYLFGSYASLHAGLTWDELAEFWTTMVNIVAVNGLLHNDMAAYQKLLSYGPRYYGVGFNIPAHLVQNLIAGPVAGYSGVSMGDGYLLSKHWLAFTLFFSSGFMVRYLMRLLTADELVSSLATIGYLLWPYVFGHAMLNVKDIPFMFAWLLCTSYSFSMVSRCWKGQKIGHVPVILLAIFTGWLISLRISGILIFLQYMITAFVFRSELRRSTLSGGVRPATNILLFLFCIVIFVYVSYPVFWLHPLDILNAVQYMSQHTIVDSCTRTFGVCIKNQPPIAYIPMWLSVKLPLLVIAGYLLLPVAYMKMASRGAGMSMQFFKASFLVTLFIPLLLALRHVVLYDEIRHVLFIMPLFFCVGVASLYFVSRKAAIISLVASACIFTADHFLAFPYQYIWFNEIARQFKVEKYFAIDYWGASGRGLAAQLLLVEKRVGPVNCIYAEPDFLIRPFMGNNFAGCFLPLDLRTLTSPRPYLTTSFSRTSTVVDCPEVQREKFRLFLGNGDITVGKVLYCK